MTVDWNKRSFVTGHELAEMPEHQRTWFKNQPKIWKWRLDADILCNLAHPDNKGLFLADLVEDACQS